MSKLSESEIETLAIERLQTLGFDYVYGPDIAPDSLNPEREIFCGGVAHQAIAQCGCSH